MVQDLFCFIEQHAEEYIEFLKEICAFETVASDKQEIDRMVEYIEQFAHSQKIATRRTSFEKCGDFLTLEINPRKEKGQLFLAHMDTVQPKGSFGYPVVTVMKDKIQAPGAIDCKGGIVIALLAMRALMACGYQKHARLILTSDEEVSNSLGGQKEMDFFQKETEGFKAALNCETTEGNEVVVSRKGILRQQIDVHGKGGHSGMDYFRASSAVLEASHKILELEQQSIEGENTYNCSVIHGGDAGNVIPEECSFIVDVRAKDQSSMEQAETLVKQIADTSHVSGTTATVTTISSRLPMVQNEDTQKLFDKMQTISQKYHLGTLVPVESGGGSDSAYTQAAGIPSLCGLGGSGGNCHTNKEYINIHSITQRAKLLAAFCAEEEDVK